MKSWKGDNILLEAEIVSFQLTCLSQPGCHNKAPQTGGLHKTLISQSSGV